MVPPDALRLVVEFCTTFGPLTASVIDWWRPESDSDAIRFTLPAPVPNTTSSVISFAFDSSSDLHVRLPGGVSTTRPWLSDAVATSDSVSPVLTEEAPVAVATAIDEMVLLITALTVTNAGELPVIEIIPVASPTGIPPLSARGYAVIE